DVLLRILGAAQAAQDRRDPARVHRARVPRSPAVLGLAGDEAPAPPAREPLTLCPRGYRRSAAGAAQTSGNGLVPVNTGALIAAGLSLGIVTVAVRLMPGPASVGVATGRLIVTIVAVTSAPVTLT